MADTNPYAIRAGLLELAKIILSENAHMAFESSMKTGDSKLVNVWKPYSSEDVIREAEKLYQFVSKK
jgi:hypothetical protein